jgi:hypothetical protein
MEAIRLLLEAAGGLLLVIATFFLYKVSEAFTKVSTQIDTLTAAIATLREELAKGYVPKGEWEELRRRFHDISGTIGKVDQWQRFHDDDDSVRQKLVAIDHTMTELSAKLYKDFVTKEEWEAIRVRLHDLNNTVAGLMAVAELERRKESRG